MPLDTLAPQPDSLRALWEADARAGDAWAPLYDTIHEVWQPCHRAYQERVAEVVYSCWYEGRGRVLQVGCRTGAILRLLSNRIPAHQLAGVDPSPKMIEKCAARAKGVELCTTAFEEYVATEAFDVVFFYNSLRHMQDHGKVAERIAQVAKPGARIAVFEPNPDWVYGDPWASRRAQWLSPSWLYWRLRSSARLGPVAEALAKLPAPPLRKEITVAELAERFSPELTLRSHRTSFGITRLYESVIGDTKAAENADRPISVQNRGWAKALRRLQKADQHLAMQHPHGGGMMELVFDRSPAWKPR